MNTDRVVISSVLVASLVLFAWGRWRYDVVAIAALIVVALFGLVDAAEVFSGFGHPAIITVAAMLVISHAMETSGVVALLGRGLAVVAVGRWSTLAVLMITVTALSGFMNNIGALVLMLPVAVHLARAQGVHKSRYLMPMAFASMLGGLITLIGTPPNIIVASFRDQAGLEGYGIFDFAPVGLMVATGGIVAMMALSGRFIPQRDPVDETRPLDHIDPYMTEVIVPEGSALIDQTLRTLEERGHGDLSVVALVRRGEELVAPRRSVQILAGDLLVIEADQESLQELISDHSLEVTGQRRFKANRLQIDDFSVVAAVVLPQSRLSGRTATGLQLRSSYGLNLLGVSRQGHDIVGRLGHTRIEPGDVLMVQGEAEAMDETLTRLDCLELADSQLTPRRRFDPVVPAIFAGAILCTAFGMVKIEVSLVAAVLLMVLLRRVSVKDIYEKVDWPVIVLLGAMIPVGGALETSGTTRLIVENFEKVGGGLGPVAIVALLMAAAMALSNIVNNAAAAVLMAPLALQLAIGLGINGDPLLMAVAVGSSCAFLTPIGHQSNLLVMGPGGYEFGDYWRLGLPVSMAVLATGVPAILWIWPA
jgi:di/tricarboxylate transporter